MKYDGYIQSSDYEDLYFDVIQPNIINFNLIFAGFKPIKNKHYLELGFGMGRSLLTHAVSNEGHFVGTDFNENQVAFAKNICEQAKISNLTLYADSFEQLLERFRKMRAKGEEVGFDFIVLHGIYCWVNEENRQIILSIIKEFLREGGVVYISYNCLPGRATNMDARHIFKLYSQKKHTENFDKIFSFTEKFAQLEPENTINKNILDTINTHRHSHPIYRIHEFLCDSWYLPYFSDMAETMKKLGNLNYICECVLAYHFKNFTPKQENFLAQINDVIFKEQMKDFILNKQFRYDLYGKRLAKLSKKWIDNYLFNTQFVLLDYPTSHTFKDCEENLKWAYIELISRLENEDFTPKSAKTLMMGIDINQRVFLSLLINLITLNLVGICVPNTTRKIDEVKFYNHSLLKNQKLSEEYIFACALTGGGISLDSLERAFLNHYFNENQMNLEELFERIYQNENFHFNDANNQVCKDRESVFTQLSLHYKKFLRRLPILMKLEMF
ncbi:methyltransferase regulatory domain-containing protein [Campylobacter upsaliensis]|uniref:methyltransferase regulatory domain-containing protein n=1 Tax=Campylobacter upsaliensis TaxID=28080 RepID=UPI0022EB252F|nr:methyltransferase regulatory domain-containing protein [Campylobacter upsaliensis]